MPFQPNESFNCGDIFHLLNLFILNFNLFGPSSLLYILCRCFWRRNSPLKCDRNGDRGPPKFHMHNYFCCSTTICTVNPQHPFIVTIIKSYESYCLVQYWNLRLVQKTEKYCFSLLPSVALAARNTVSCIPTGHPRCLLDSPCLTILRFVLVFRSSILWRRSNSDF